jgi:putative MATE family efflux protein
MMATIESSLDITASVPKVGGMQRRVLNLAWPVIAENFLETTLGIVDTWLVSHLAYGAIALAGVGVAVQVMQFLLAMLAALSIGASVLVAQAVGARNVSRANNLARQSLAWSVIISVPLAIAGLIFSGPIIEMFGMERAASDIAVSYLHVTMGTVVVLTGLYIGGGVLRGAGDTRTPLVVTTIANVINIPLAWALIYGQLGLPQLGPVGSAWATFIARGIALILMLIALWRGRAGIRIRGRGEWRPDVGVARQVLTIGVPAALEQILLASSLFFLTVVVGQLGTDTLAANRIVVSMLSLAFLPGIGFAIAATTLVGQSVGAQRIEVGAAAARIATRWAMIWMGTMGLVSVFFAPQVMGLFTGDPAVIDAGALGMRVLAISQPVWAITFVQAGGLRGLGNTRAPMIVFGGGLWVCAVAAAVAVSVFGGGLATIWAAYAVIAPAIAWLMWRRFRATVEKFSDHQLSAR